MKIKTVLFITIFAVFSTNGQLQRGGAMSGSTYETRLAEKVRYAEWRDRSAGLESRFHSAFEFELPEKEWKLLSIDKSQYPEDFVFNCVEKDYVSAHDTNQGIVVKIALCESIRAAHEFLFTSLLRITNPAFPFAYPNAAGIGDVYFSGFWARDNVFISVLSFLSTPVANKRIAELSGMIDAKLTARPPTSKDVVPAIREFAIQAKIIPIGEFVPLRVALPDGNDGATLLFWASGGTVSRKAGVYFYKPDTLGSHSIQLFVTDHSGKTTVASLNVTVVE
jgi:hypothetical protein